MVGLYIKGKKDAPGKMQCQKNMKGYKRLKILKDF